MENLNKNVRMRWRVIFISICLLFSLVLKAEIGKDSLFSWSANASMTSNYIWRGLYCGGPSLQVDATVSYAGVFANVWWNVGTRNWTFEGFNPEVDIAIGFSRWGLTVYYLHCFYFDRYADGRVSRFFDFKNHAPGGGGTTGEWRVLYRISDRLPLSCLVACRTFSRDGYILNGELKRAYSTYIELGYDFDLTHDWRLDARVGITPAKSLYTGYQGDFAVTLVGLKLQKQWVLDRFSGSKTSGMVVRAFANVMLQPWKVNKHNLVMPISDASSQKLNLAVGCNVEIGG